MKTEHLSRTATITLLIVAGIFDFIKFCFGLIPVVGWIFDIFWDAVAGMTLALWFAHHGISVMKKTPGTFLATLALSMFPLVELLPGWTFFTLRMIAQDRIS